MNCGKYLFIKHKEYSGNKNYKEIISEENCIICEFITHQTENRII